MIIRCLLRGSIPRGSDGKEEFSCNAVNPDLLPGLGRSPGVGNGNQYSCLENPMDRGAWCAADHRVTESDTTRVK